MLQHGLTRTWLLHIHTSQPAPSMHRRCYCGPTCCSMTLCRKDKGVKTWCYQVSGVQRTQATWIWICVKSCTQKNKPWLLNSLSWGNHHRGGDLYLFSLSFSAWTLHHHPGGNPHLYLCPFLLERFIIILVAIHTYTSVLFCVNAASLSWLKSTLIPLSCSAQTLYHHPGGNPHLIPLSCAARTRNHHPGGNPHFFLRPALLERLKTALYADMSDLRKTCNWRVWPYKNWNTVSRQTCPCFVTCV